MRKLEPTREKEIKYVIETINGENNLPDEYSILSKEYRMPLARNILVIELAIKLASVFDRVDLYNFYSNNVHQFKSYLINKREYYLAMNELYFIALKLMSDNFYNELKLKVEKCGKKKPVEYFETIFKSIN